MDEDETSPRNGLNSEDANRLNEMENRVMTLEDQLSKALDEVRDARSREMGIMNVVRDVIVHLATIEKGEFVISLAQASEHLLTSRVNRFLSRC
jgi:osomolarity two-component system response regulator SKN7